MKHIRLIVVILCGNLWLACEDPPVVSYSQPKPEVMEVLEITASNFTLQDFDSNNTDHQRIRQAICQELKIRYDELTQAHLAKVERLDLFGQEIEKIEKSLSEYIFIK